MNHWRDDREMTPARVRTLSLLDLLPELLERIPADGHARAGQMLLAHLITVEDEDVTARILQSKDVAFDFLVVDGVILKSTSLEGESALELLTPGDFLAPLLTPVRQLEQRATSRYQAHGEVTLAVLDRHFITATRHWPGLAEVLHERLGRQTHRASMHLAMLHGARVQDRILLLFADLGERLGHVTADGILIDFPLTHDLLGRLVGSRPPTISLALRDLEGEGALQRLDDGRWLVKR